MKVNKQIQKSNFQEQNYQEFYSIEVLKIYRALLLDSVLHLEALKYLEIFLKNKTIADLLKRLKIHLIIAKFLEKDHPQSNIQNVLRYLKFVKRWIQRSHENFP